MAAEYPFEGQAVTSFLRYLHVSLVISRGSLSLQECCALFADSACCCPLARKTAKPVEGCKEGRRNQRNR